MSYDAYECAVYEADIAGGTADPDSRYGWPQEHVLQQYVPPDVQHGSAVYGQQGHLKDHKEYHPYSMASQYAQPAQAAAYGRLVPQIPDPVAVGAAHEDSLKAVKDLPPAFHSCFSFR